MINQNYEILRGDSKSNLLPFNLVSEFFKITNVRLQNFDLLSQNCYLVSQIFDLLRLT